MHDGVHDAFHGPFNTSGGSTNDPFFPLHHIQLDRVFSAWFRSHKPSGNALPTGGVMPGQCRDCNLVAFFPPVPNSRMFTDTRQLGYDYDSLRFGRG